MADLKLIKRFLQSQRVYNVCTVTLDEFTYDVARINRISEDTGLFDTVIIGFNLDKISEDKITVTPHCITLSDLEGADTVLFGTHTVMEKIV